MSQTSMTFPPRYTTSLCSMKSLVLHVNYWKYIVKTSVFFNEIFNHNNKYGNCSNLEQECSEPLFKLEWTKKNGWWNARYLWTRIAFICSLRRDRSGKLNELLQTKYLGVHCGIHRERSITISKVPGLCRSSCWRRVIGIFFIWIW